MNFFSSKEPSREEIRRDNYIKKNINDALGKSLKLLQQQYVTSDEAIQSEDSANTVCNIIEAALLHGLKASFSNKSFWELLLAVTHSEVLSQLNHLAQITTEIGMCRAWIRLALNDGVLESYWDAMLADAKIVRKLYKKTAFLRDAEQPDIFKSYLQGLLNFNFKLSYNSSVLNIWTSTPLILAGIIEGTVAPLAGQASSGVAVLSTSPPIHEAAAATEETEEASSSVSITQPGPSSSREGRKRQSKAGRARVVASMAYTDDPTNTLPGTPPNSPLDATQLTRGDIEEIRKMTRRNRHSSDGASTPTSQISCPDPSDNRYMSPECRVLGQSPSSGTKMPRYGGIMANDYLENQIRITEEEVMDTSNGIVFQSKPKKKASKNQSSSKFDFEKIDTSDIQSRLERYAALEEELQADLTGSDAAVPHSETEITTQRGTQEQEGVTEQHHKKVLPDSTVETSSLGGADAPKSIQTDLSLSKAEGNQGSPSHASGGEGPSLGDQESKEVNRSSPASLGSPSRATQHAPFKHLRRKSLPLQPVESNVTATSTFVEVASEATNEATGLKLEPSIYDMFGGPMTHSNSLGANIGQMKGWSSDFDPSEGTFVVLKNDLPPYTEGQPPPYVPEEDEAVKKLLESEEETFDDLLQDYRPNIGAVSSPTMTEVLQDLPDAPSSGTPASPHPAEDDNIAEDLNYEVLPASASLITAHPNDSRSQNLLSMVGEISQEKGLDYQNYQCKGCSRPIGMIYGKGRVCSYDGCYYCFECHENDEYYIPARIVHNWDFRKHKVSKHCLTFLTQIVEEPLVNLEESNPRLYEHVPEVQQIKNLRLQLRSLRSYLFTCKQSVADDFRKQVWPKEYLYENVDLYSLQDLLDVISGTLATLIRKVIKFAIKHVYDCRLCSQKGFICEICDNPKAIYPFEVDSTYKCERCNAVYHKDCKKELVPCPKCERLQMRKRYGSTSEQMMDYAIIPDEPESEDAACRPEM